MSQSLNRTALLFSLALVACKSDGPVDTAVEGSGWSLMAANVSEGVLLSLWPASASEVLFVGGGMGREGPGILARYRPQDNTLCWQEILSDKALWWVHGVDENDWYAVGEKGAIVHYTTAGGFQDESVDTLRTLYGVWVDGDIVWAVGGSFGGSPTGTGEIWRKDAAGWAVFAEDLPGTLFKVWEGHFVGNQEAYRLDAVGALEDIAPGEHKLLTLRGRSATDIWAVGGTQAADVMHFDGENWTSIQTAGLSLPLMGVWTAPGEPVWVSGMNGVQAYSDDDGATWVIPDFPLTGDSFHAVRAVGDEVLFAGGNLMSTSGEFHGTIGRYGPPRGPVTTSKCVE
jgi:hypothetical protein